MLSPVLLAIAAFLAFAASAYFLSGWIARRLRPDVHPFVAYALTFLVLQGAPSFGTDAADARLVWWLVLAAALGFAAIDRARRGVTVRDRP